MFAVQMPAKIDIYFFDYLNKSLKTPQNYVTDIKVRKILCFKKKERLLESEGNGFEY